MLTCTQQECDPDHMQTMYSACCPASAGAAWPCDTPQCDSEECLNELTAVAQVCPLALLNDDGVTQTMQKCQQIQDAAAAAGVDDAARQECETNNRHAISDMHRACCPQGWPCACNPAAATPCASVDSTELQCGQEETECLGLLNTLVATDCASLSFDPQVQAVYAECSYRGIAAAPPAVTGGRGAQSGRGGNGRPGDGRGGVRSGQQSIADPPAPPPTGNSTGGDGPNIGLLVGGLLVIAVAGAAYLKTKGKSGGAGGCRHSRCHFTFPMYPLPSAV